MKTEKCPISKDGSVCQEKLCQWWIERVQCCAILAIGAYCAYMMDKALKEDERKK